MTKQSDSITACRAIKPREIIAKYEKRGKY